MHFQLATYTAKCALGYRMHMHIINPFTFTCTHLGMWMVRRRSVMVGAHQRGQLLVHTVDDPTPEHAGARHITIRHYHVPADISHVHSSLNRTHRHRGVELIWMTRIWH